jgi:dipeptidyl aminopeptidase/acylaminoacyl peptidase
MTKDQSAISITRLAGLPRINDTQFGAEGHLLRHETVEGNGELRLLADRGQWKTINGDLDVRAGIGYGGGDFAASHENALFTARGAGLFRVSLRPPFKPHCIYPSSDPIASVCVSADEKWALFIQSRQERETLLMVGLDGQSPAVELASGADFYMGPAWHPSGRLVAWVEWDHPHMPWDASRVRLGRLPPGITRLTPLDWTAGGVGCAASQPRFSPDGRWLSFIIQTGDWDNLVIYELDTGQEITLLKGEGYHLRLPEWVQGMRSYAWSPGSDSIYHFRYHQAQTTLWNTGLPGGSSRQVDISPIRWAGQLDISTRNGELVFIGSAPGIPKQVCRLSDDVLARESVALERQLSTGNFQPQHYDFSTADGSKAFGLYYPPYGQVQSDAPLVLHIHGGPTAAADLGFNHEAVFFSSRGYGYAEVNYRGSATYGYSYQNALHKNWGIVDVQDTIAMADWLVQNGWVHPDRMALFGSSAGGFTVLNTLITSTGRFKAGICSYGVSDLVADARNTHKFEKYYHRFLIGDLEQDRQRFIARSPIHQAGRISDPLLLFHGGQDPVVDISQTEEIFRQLKEIGVPCQMITYPDEGHGFRKMENISDYYLRIERFLEETIK